jgi:septum formation protein
MLYLASRSPRRIDLLGRLGVPFTALDMEVEEVRAATETPLQYVCRVAADKARAGLVQLMPAVQPCWVLGSDTEVVLGEHVYGKPVDAADAQAMLASLAGRTHQVITAVALAGHDGAVEVIHVSSDVTFEAMDAATIAAYVASGEPMGKAGAYAIQGGAERHVSRLCGSYSGVMGLPLQQTAQLLQRHGLLAVS